MTLKNIVGFLSIMAGLFVANAHADIRMIAQLQVNHWDSNNHKERVIHVGFDNVWVPENHYAGISTFYHETGYKLSIRVVSISDTTVTMELAVEDAKNDVIFNQLFACTWNTPTSLKAGTVKLNNEANLVSLTVTTSQIHTATAKEVASCSSKLALAYTLRSMFVTPPIVGLIAAGITSNMVYQALSGSSETVACGAALIAALVALPATGIVACMPAAWLDSKYEKSFGTHSFRLIKEEARIKSLRYEAYAFFGIVGSLLTGLMVMAAK